jgi:hypothetical protein
VSPPEKAWQANCLEVEECPDTIPHEGIERREWDYAKRCSSARADGLSNGFRPDNECRRNADAGKLVGAVFMSSPPGNAQPHGFDGYKETACALQ